MRHSLLILSIFCSVFGWSQKASFSLDQINGEVLVSVSIHSGNFCNGIQVLRSKDSINFEVIETIQGYCGDINETLTYYITDEDPIVNQKSYYKAILVGLTTTEVKSILVLDFGNNEYNLTTNPITSTSTLYFKNAPNKEATLTFYNLSGQETYRQTSNNAYFDINASEHVNGIYIFSVKDEDQKELAAGKLMISNP